MAFPSTRPTVRITRSKSTIQSVDCPELHWWFALPRANEDYAFALYDAETQKLARVVTLKPIRVQGFGQRDIVQIDITDNWLADREKAMFPPRMRLLASLDAEKASFLAVTNLSHEDNVIDTIAEGDPDFESQWGTVCRHLEDNGKFESLNDGAWRTTGKDGLVEGTYDVNIGNNCFKCLRVLDYDEDEPFGGELAEAYVECTSGRTVYYREFTGRFYRQSRIENCEPIPGVDLLELHPHNARLVIDGVIYVHCGCTMRAHDTITLAGLGALNL